MKDFVPVACRNHEREDGDAGIRHMQAACTSRSASHGMTRPSPGAAQRDGEERARACPRSPGTNLRSYHKYEVRGALKPMHSIT